MTRLAKLCIPPIIVAIALTLLPGSDLFFSIEPVRDTLGLMGPALFIPTTGSVVLFVSYLSAYAVRLTNIKSVPLMALLMGTFSIPLFFLCWTVISILMTSSVGGVPMNVVIVAFNVVGLWTLGKKLVNEG